MELSFGEQVKIVLRRKGLTIKELAEQIEAQTGMKMSRQNLTQRLMRDNFQERDMRMIAAVLGCKITLTIMEEEDESIPAYTYVAPKEEPAVNVAEAIEKQLTIEEVQEEAAELAGHRRPAKAPNTVETAVTEKATALTEAADAKADTEAETQIQTQAEAEADAVVATDGADEEAVVATPEVVEETVEEETATEAEDAVVDTDWAAAEAARLAEEVAHREELERARKEAAERARRDAEEAIRLAEEESRREEEERRAAAFAKMTPEEREQRLQAEEAERERIRSIAQRAVAASQKSENSFLGNNRIDYVGKQQRQRRQQNGDAEGASAAARIEGESLVQAAKRDAETQAVLSNTSDMGVIPDSFRSVPRNAETRENKPEINPRTGEEYESNVVRNHPRLKGYIQVYDRGEHRWIDMTEWAFLGFQERKKVMLGVDYKPPKYLD